MKNNLNDTMFYNKQANLQSVMIGNSFCSAHYMQSKFKRLIINENHHQMKKKIYSWTKCNRSLILFNSNEKNVDQRNFFIGQISQVSMFLKVFLNRTFRRNSKFLHFNHPTWWYWSESLDGSAELSKGIHLKKASILRYK